MLVTACLCNPRSKVRKACTDFVRTKLRVVFIKPDPANMARNKMLLDLLDYADKDKTGHFVDNENLSKRQAARRMLLKICPGNWADPSDFVHWCDHSVQPIGCSEDVSRQRERSVAFSVMVGSVSLRFPVLSRDYHTTSQTQ